MLLLNKDNLSEILIRAIDKNGVSHEKIAGEVGVTAMTVYRWKIRESFPKSKAVLNSLKNYLEKGEING